MFYDVILNIPTWSRLTPINVHTYLPHPFVIEEKMIALSFLLSLSACLLWTGAEGKLILSTSTNIVDSRPVHAYIYAKKR